MTLQQGRYALLLLLLLLLLLCQSVVSKSTSESRVHYFLKPTRGIYWTTGGFEVEHKNKKKVSERKFLQENMPPSVKEDNCVN